MGIQNSSSAYQPSYCMTTDEWDNKIIYLTDLIFVKKIILSRYTSRNSLLEILFKLHAGSEMLMVLILAEKSFKITGVFIRLAAARRKCTVLFINIEICYIIYLLF